MMTGWKTWAASIGSILWGVVGFISDAHDISTMMAFVSGGLAAIGIGHKIEKA